MTVACVAAAAWGNHGTLYSRGDIVKRMAQDAGLRLKAFRITQKGQPEHPLFQTDDAQLFDLFAQQAVELKK